MKKSPATRAKKSVERHKLTVDFIEKLRCPPDQSKRFVYDTLVQGFAVRVMPSGVKSYVWVGREGGKTVFRTLGRVGVMNFPEAREAARAQVADAFQKTRAVEQGEDTDGDEIGIAEAFDMTLAASRRGSRSKQDWNYAVRVFLRWLSKKHPKVTLWKQMNRRLLENYLEGYADHSANARRLATQPIVQTSRRMATLYAHRRFADDLRIGNKPAKPPARIFPADALGLLKYVREHSPRLEVGVALQAFAGLRPSEAQRLTWDRVDFDRGLIEISGETKNEWSNRTIPVPGVVMDALERAHACASSAKVRDVRGNVVLSTLGYPYHGKSADNYGKEVTDLIRAWHAEIREELEAEKGQKLSPVTWTCKDLRNLIPTIAQSRGLAGAAVWEQYIGHSPGGVTERHYTPRLVQSTPGEQEAFENAMDTLRRLVVDVVEEEIQRADQPGKAAVREVDLGK